MPKLTEESTQRFTPITKPSSDNASTLTNLITPVPIHGSSTPTSTITKNQTDFNTNNGKHITTIPTDETRQAFRPRRKQRKTSVLKSIASSSWFTDRRTQPSSKIPTDETEAKTVETSILKHCFLLMVH
jgi:hypothetical protein